MNKTYVVVGGASVSSLAVGCTAGYLFAKYKINKTIDGIVLREIAKTEKHYAVLLQEARSGKPASPADIVSREPVVIDESVVDVLDEEESLNDEGPLELEGDDYEEPAARAIVDYQGVSKRIVGEEKPALDTIVTSNIFTDDKPKKTLPPREPGSGKFMPKQAVPDVRTPQEPYIISHEEFFENEPDWDQETLVYFRNDNTLVIKADPTETVDVEVIGESILKSFPSVDEGLISILAVRVESKHTDYEIELNDGSLTEYIGLGADAYL